MGAMRPKKALLRCRLVVVASGQKPASVIVDGPTRDQCQAEFESGHMDMLAKTAVNQNDSGTHCKVGPTNPSLQYTIWFESPIDSVQMKAAKVRLVNIKVQLRYKAEQSERAKDPTHNVRARCNLCHADKWVWRGNSDFTNNKNLHGN
jgi:hypothetical protein